MRDLWQKLGFGSTHIVVIVLIALFTILFGYFLMVFFPVREIQYTTLPASIYEAVKEATTTPAFVVTHVKTPDPLKAVYFSSWAAGNKKFRKELFDLVDKTEVNAVVIDIKDYTGRVSFKMDDPLVKAYGSVEERIPDIEQFIGELHKRGTYVIGRISSFQDSYLINIHPEWAVKNKAGGVWHDYKNVKWLDAGATPVWDYLVAIGRASYNVGFDELNFDYIRFPSDGDLTNIQYTWSEGRARSVVMKDFFMYLRSQFEEGTIPISADLFGLTTSAVGDLGIGQVIENAFPYFDYIYPMVYPSHFGAGFIGYAKPAQHPYEVIKYSMEHAIEKATNASSTPSKIRPWLQAFDLGAIYDPSMIRSQIQATYDSGLTSWLLWNAACVYNVAALLPKETNTGVTVTTP